MINLDNWEELPQEVLPAPAGVLRRREERPPAFKGALNEDVDDWIEEFEQVAAYNQWTDAEKRRNVPFCLLETARNWYQARPRALDWVQFTQKIIVGFRSVHFELSRRERLWSRMQGAEESALSYCYAMDHLCTKVNPQMHDSERIQLITQGLNSTMKAAVLPFFAHREATCADLFRQVRIQSEVLEAGPLTATRLSTAVNSSSPDPRPPSPKRRNLEPSAELADLRLKIRELEDKRRKEETKSGPVHKSFTCTSCGRAGHVAAYCRYGRQGDSNPRRVQLDRDGVYRQQEPQNGNLNGTGRP